MSTKMRVGLQVLFPRFTCIVATANVLWPIRLRKKELKKWLKELIW